ncbi:MAG: glycosyltransferase family 2 protein [Anaerolineaceae bacterium]|nr:glycosyltransferase family 2 protein [Anaerolineaceae bacterium]
MEQPYLSLIFPAHNEEKRLPHTLEQTLEFLDQQAYTSEVIVVENGSQDRTLEIAEEAARRSPLLHVIHETERGKGRAVQRGMLAARGEYRIFCDVDLSMPITEVNRFIPPILTDVDIAIASREAPGAVRYKEPVYRHLVGRVFNSLVRWSALPGLNDTQCGFKCFRAAVAGDIFPCQTMMGWSFDVEVLFIARLRGYRIVEIPIPWYFNPDSKVRLLQDSLRMGSDILSMRRKAGRGCYDRPF